MNYSYSSYVDRLRRRPSRPSRSRVLKTGHRLNGACWQDGLWAAGPEGACLTGATRCRPPASSPAFLRFLLLYFMQQLRLFSLWRWSRLQWGSNEFRVISSTVYNYRRCYSVLWKKLFWRVSAILPLTQILCLRAAAYWQLKGFENIKMCGHMNLTVGYMRMHNTTFKRKKNGQSWGNLLSLYR